MPFRREAGKVFWIQGPDRYEVTIHEEYEYRGGTYLRRAHWAIEGTFADELGDILDRADKQS